MTLPALPTGHIGREFLRIGGGYAAPAKGQSPAGGLDIDNAGNLATSGDVTIDGALAVGGMTQVWSRFLPARELWLPDDAPAAGPNRLHLAWLQEVHTFDFNAAAKTSIAFNVVLPPHYDGRPVTANLYWTATAGASGDVHWWLVARAYGHGGSLLSAYGATYSAVTTFQGVNTLHITPLTFTPEAASAGDFLLVALRRFGDAATDTFNADARLMGIRLDFA